MKKQRHDFSHGCAPERNMAMTLVMAWFRSGTRRWQKQSFAAANFGAMLAALGVPVGGPEAAKRDKNWTKIALKFNADYGMHFGT